MADYENLGFQVNVDSDNAVSRLDKIIGRLEKIQKLGGSGFGIGASSSKGGRPSGYTKGLTDEEKWEKQYQDRVRKQAYYLQQGYVQQKNIISDHTKWVLAEEKKLEKKKFLTEQGYIKPKEPKIQLSEEAKYLNRITRQTQLLNSAKYEEARKTELANQQRKKEIDQRLKQKLGIKDATNSLGKYITKLTSVVVLAKKLAHFMSSAIKESAEYVENLNLFAVAYGKTYQEQIDWALGIAKAYGLANNEVLKFAGTFRELSTSLGLVGDTADLVSEVVTNLGYDLSALFNTTVEQAMEKLQSGVFSGNVRPLRAYGIDISQQQINELFETNEALRQLGVNAQNLNQSDKVLARLIITLQSGKDSFGTMAREINNLQSQFRIFEGSLSNLKLAIGDAINKPLSEAMVYINGFIIGITNVIRAFVPLTTEDATPKAIINTATSAEEANEELDKLQVKLAGFDKFNVLQQGGGETSSIAITEALNQLLLEQSAIYESQLGNLDEINNRAVEIGENIKNWFVVEKGKDEQGNPIYVLTTQAETLLETLKLLGIYLSISLIGKIGGAVKAISTLTKGFGTLNSVLAAGVIYAFITLIDAIEKGDTFSAAFAATLGSVLVGAIIAVKLSMLKGTETGLGFIDMIKAGASQIGIMVGGLTLLIAGIVSISNAWGDMGGWQRAITIVSALTAAIIGMVVAIKAFSVSVPVAIGLGAALAGSVLLIGSQLGKNSVHKFADGGYSNANLIMTHENGKREWVGKAAGSSAIVNDTQMSDIMQVAVAKGVYQAMTARSEMNGPMQDNRPIVVQVDGKTIFEATRGYAKRQGLDYSKV